MDAGGAEEAEALRNQRSVWDSSVVRWVIHDSFWCDAGGGRVSTSAGPSGHGASSGFQMVRSSPLASVPLVL